MARKRGMGETEIRKKLELLKTTKEKYTYLKKLSKKASLMKPKTRKNFYKLLGGYAEKIGELNLKKDHFFDAGEHYEYAASCYQKAGLKKKTREAFEKAIDAFYKELANL